MPTNLPQKQHPGSWLQTERAAHEAWANLIAEAPKAAQLMHLLVARIGEHNAVVISQKNLIRLMGASRPTVQRAVKKLRDDLWVEVRQIGDRGTTNAYIINDRIAWRGKRDGIRYSLFSAAVVVSDDEQPDAERLDHQQPLRRIPSIGRGEQQLPVGPGLPPPSEPSLPGMEPDLPATEIND
jgi:DNA-binding transcriptional MocR family regulator